MADGDGNKVTTRVLLKLRGECARDWRGGRVWWRRVAGVEAGFVVEQQDWDSVQSLK